VRSACLSGEIFSDPYVVATSTMAMQYAISYSIDKKKRILKGTKALLLPSAISSLHILKVKFVVQMPKFFKLK